MAGTPSASEGPEYDVVGVARAWGVVEGRMTIGVAVTGPVVNVSVITGLKLVHKLNWSGIMLRITKPQKSIINTVKIALIIAQRLSSGLGSMTCKFYQFCLSGG